LLASREQERRTLKASRKEKKLRDGYQHKTMEIFIANEASRGYNNGCPFNSRMPTRVRHFGNRSSRVGYPDGQASYPTFQKKVHRDVTVVQAGDMCCELIDVY
jgi:hypothetical protein